MRYVGINGTEYIIEKRIAGGGEGSIHELAGREAQVAKICKPERRDREREEKLREMVKQKLSDEQLEQIVWPQDVLYNNGVFVGYVMPKLRNTDSLTMIYGSSGADKYNLRNRLLVAINLSYAIQTVHEMNQVCGDLNPQNICVNLNENDRNTAFQVTLVDTDSYHYVMSDKVYRCEVGLGEYLAPEIQRKLSGGGSLKDVELPTYTRETDLYALATHIFALLFNGCHPFACAKEVNGKMENDMGQFDAGMYKESVVAPQPIDNIKNGFFPFYHKREGITYPLYAPSFDSLPENLRKLFVRTFVDGYNNPTARVSALEWADALLSVANQIMVCRDDSSHCYFNHNVNCPLCSVNKRVWQVFAEEYPTHESPADEITVGKDSSGLYNYPVEEDSDESYEPVAGNNMILSVVAGVILAFLVGMIIFAIYTEFFDRSDDVVNQGGTSLSEEYEEDTYPSEYYQIAFKELYDSYLANAKSLLENGGYDEVILNCDNAISINGETDATPYYYKACALYYLGKLDDARAVVNQGIDIEYTDELYELETAIDDAIIQKENVSKQLSYGKKIIRSINNKKYAAAVKRIKNGYEKSFFTGKKKIYIKNGKIVKTIKNGKGFVYYIWDDYVYVGKFKNGKPNGNGLEVGGTPRSYYTVKGNFKNGYPNGKCTVHYDEEYKGTRSTYYGTYKNGWENGDFTWVSKSLDGGHSDTYYFSSDMGTRKIREIIKGKYVYAEAKSGWYYYADDKSSLKGNTTPNYKKKR